MSRWSLSKSSPSVDEIDVVAYGVHWLGYGRSCGEVAHQQCPKWSVRSGVPTSEPNGVRAVGLPLHHGRAVLDRVDRSVVVDTTTTVTPAAFEHPYLSGIAAIVAWWAGDLPLHAGWFLLAGRAVVVLGSSGQGKSTLLAGLADVGVPVGADDLVVVRGRKAQAGPRFLDLRQGAGPRYGGPQSDPELTAAGRTRWRIALADCPQTAPLGLVVTLDWGLRPEAAAVPIGDRVRRLFQARSLQLRDDQEAARQVMALADLPMLRFSRPRELGSADEANGALLTAARDLLS